LLLISLLYNDDDDDDTMKTAIVNQITPTKQLLTHQSLATDKPLKTALIKTHVTV